MPATNQLSADIVTMSDLLLDIKESVYCSVQKFPHRADILSDLWRNNGSLIAAQKQAGLLALGAHDYYRYRCGPDDAFSFNCHKPDSWEDETLAGVMYSDAAVIENFTRAEFDHLAVAIQRQS